jgi:hypothetical protein
MSEQRDIDRLDPEGRVPPSRYFVTMTVSTYVEARDEAAAMQGGCDLVHPLVMDGLLAVHTVDAKWAPSYSPPGSEEVGDV